MTMLKTMTDVQERVSRGVAFLDENVPGWESKIILDSLDMWSGCACVCGFTFAEDAEREEDSDGFEYAIRVFGDGRQDPESPFRSLWAEENGFDYTTGVTTYKDLQAEWIKVLTDRQNVS